MRRTILRGILMGVISVVVGVCTVIPVRALSEAQLYFFGQNGIYFYDPDGNPSCGSGTISGDKVTVIGDSISVGAESQYNAQIPNADLSSKTYNGATYQLIQVSKAFNTGSASNYSGVEIARVLQEQGELRPYVVFALGTNSPGRVTDAAIEELMELVGTNHKVVLTTNYAVGNQLDFSVNNAAILAAAEKYSGKVAVADWAKAVEGDPAKYIGDNYVHPNAAGSELFVRLVKQALNELAGGAGGGTTGSNRNYAGAQVWSDAEMQAIEANRAIYEEAANKYNIPWAVLAVLHSLETGLQRYNPSNGQGVYQLYSYTGGGGNANRFAPASEISEAEFREQTMLAAEIVSGMAGDLNNPDNVKRLFFQYNGLAGQYIQKALAMGFTEEEANNGEGSAYVMNRYDAARDPESAAMSPLWPGRFVADGVYDAGSTSSGFGAFVKYEAIAGSSYCSAAGGTIVEVAIALSWEGHDHSKDDPKPEYVTAMQEVGTYVDPCNGTGCAPKGASCDIFVSTVMRYSGADPEFPEYGPGRQQAWMDEHPEMYMRVEAGQDVARLEPGDIFVVSNGNGAHIYLYIGEIDGQPSQASASFNGRTGEHFAGISWSDYGMEYAIYRRIQ